MTQVWKDLNVSLNLAPHLNVHSALGELVMNALDAAPTSVPQFDGQGTTVVLQDQGPGLTLESFIVGRTHGDGKLAGRFGLGLKDAVAVLMRHSARVEIASRRGSYRFEVRQGALGSKTVHVQQGERVGTGTTITVTKLPNAAQSVAAVKGSFRCWTDLEVLCSNSSVDVMVPTWQAGKQRGKLFVNGVAMTPPQPLFLSYDFKKPSSKQRDACGRDHSVEGPHFTKHFRGPIEKLLLKGSRLPAAPAEPVCEFRWNAVRARYFPEVARATTSAPRRRGDGAVRPELQHQAAQQQLRVQLCQQLANLAALCPPPDLPDRRPSAAASSSIQATPGPVARAEIDRLIQDSSRDDAVPEGHKRIVSRLSLTLQECPHLSVSKVFPGGSYAKGTTIGTSSDVDLMVVLNDTPTRNHERWLHVLLATLRTTVEKAFPGECQVVRTTRYALQLRFAEVDVDLLPVPTKLWETHDRLEAIEAMPVGERRWLSVTFAQEQVAFVKREKETAGVTGVIRLIKRWVKLQNWRSGRAKPKSYCIELLVIHAKGSAGSQDKLELLKQFWQCVRDCHLLEARLDQTPHRDIACERPLVVDPANPTNNVAGCFDWYEWQQRATCICDSGLRQFVNDLAA